MSARRYSPDSEKELAAPVRTWFEDQGWIVHEEVKLYDHIADFVVTRGPLIAVCEAKLSLGLPVLAQCHRWKPYTHFSWAAVPWGGHGFAEQVASSFGIGVLRVRREGSRPDYDVTEVIHPELRRDPVDALRNVLSPAHRDGSYARAGTSCGERYSPFKETCRRLREVVDEAPGITLSAAMAKTKHHYRTSTSARSAMSHWLRDGSVAGVELRKEGRVLKLYPIGGTP